MKLDQALERLRDGRSTFDEFVSVTREQWSSMARYIMRKWRLPEWAHLEDIEQELLFAVWSCLWNYEPSRGVPLKRYVVFNALDRAKKQMHKVRGASYGGRGVDFNPSRIELPFTTYSVLFDQEWIDKILCVDPDQIDRLEKQDSVKRVQRTCRSSREWYAVRALGETGSIEMSARLIYSDPDSRLDCRLRNENHALRVVEKAAMDVAERMRFAA